MLHTLIVCSIELCYMTIHGESVYSLIPCVEILQISWRNEAKHFYQYVLPLLRNGIANIIKFS